MNRTVNKSIAAILLAIICAFMPISAAEAATEKNQRLVSEETMYVDSYIITVSVYEDDNTNLATPLATTYEKSGKKTYIAKNNSGTVFFTFTINGTFTVSSHGSAFCTKASYTYSIKDSAWEFKSATAERSANKAIGDAKFIRKALLVVVSTIEPHVVLTCDNNGNFS